MRLLDRLVGKKQFQLVEVVELTSVDIFTNSLAQVRALIRQNAIPTLGANVDKLTAEAWDMILEFMEFSLHLADRIAFNALGPEKRIIFMDKLLLSVAFNLAGSMLQKASDDERYAFVGSFTGHYGKRVAFYGTLQLASGGEASLRGTLFWEAAKVIANACCPNDPSLARLILSVNLGQCIEGVTNLAVRLAEVRD